MAVTAGAIQRWPMTILAISAKGADIVAKQKQE